MWDQVRVDHGTEFYLSLYAQEINADLRRNTNRQPYIQTQSKRVRTGRCCRLLCPSPFSDLMVENKNICLANLLALGLLAIRYKRMNTSCTCFK